MYVRFSSFPLACLLLCIIGCASPGPGAVTLYLIGDSTVADYADNYEPGENYMQTRYPVTGWGQVMQERFDTTDLSAFQGLFSADSVIVDDRARGGRSTRTFFQEGRWREVHRLLRPGDLVLMQFGHNDAAEGKPERYVDVEGYQEFLRLYVAQSRERGATPIILTPVARNYPWKNGHLENVHGEYPEAAKAIAEETGTAIIDLNQLSMDAFSERGREYVTTHYFMNLPAGKYPAYPDGQDDNTHFQPEGAGAVADLVFASLRDLRP
ncbi:lysophospholipase L1-like esterase [Neolewinella xylanilytica]|uniref:Lysophospholipase L1-like esterase n=1 Tax=Neolewinella xylanilytica TaxID=1514080 RepID=A0A2S6I366_9BACT|nr:rhamnogalacturonan acetylesterase [Neolewinella xylanilytica]PPK85632.1 lysophospholipase L1-like esterase [Neolewinella xylanilytica]